MKIETKLSINDTVWETDDFNIPTEYAICEITIIAKKDKPVLVLYFAYQREKPETLNERLDFEEWEIGQTVFLTEQELLDSL